MDSGGNEVNARLPQSDIIGPMPSSPFQSQQVVDPVPNDISPPTTFHTSDDNSLMTTSAPPDQTNVVSIGSSSDDEISKATKIPKTNKNRCVESSYTTTTNTSPSPPSPHCSPLPSPPKSSPEVQTEQSAGLHARKLKLLFLFSGPVRGDDSLEAYVGELGGEMVCIDTLRDPVRHNLADEFVVNRYMSEIEAGMYDGGALSPPCGTFSGVRELQRGRRGPRPLRGPEYPELLGLKTLSLKEKRECALGTLLAENTALALDKFCKRLVPWIFEQPAPVPGKTAYDKTESLSGSFEEI